MSVKNTNPGTLFGGTWTAWGAGRVPVGINTSDTDFSTVEKTGGEKTVTLTTTQMPSHTHSYAHTHTTPSTSISSSGAHTHVTRLRSDTSVGEGLQGERIGTSVYVKTTENAIESSGAHTHTVPAMTTNKQSTSTSGSVGGGSSHNNIQPYITCYMWKRTA